TKLPPYAARMRQLRAGRYERTRDAHDSGVQLLAGTDAGGVLGHGIIHDEPDEFTRPGSDPVVILDAAIWLPRGSLGVPGLEDGAPADLLVVPRDRRSDLRALRELDHVVLGGRIVACGTGGRHDTWKGPVPPPCAPAHRFPGGAVTASPGIL